MEQCFDKLYDELCKAASKENIILNEPMSRHTSFHIGGPAGYFVTPSDKDELCRIIDCCRKNKANYFILGNGSNLLVSDKGYDGVIINTSKSLGAISVQEDMIYADAGVLLSKISSAALANELTGFEFASGIPGTLGGAIVMNAGAYGGEMKDVVVSVNAYDPNTNSIVTMLPCELKFGYRTSAFKELDHVVLDVCLKLKNGDPLEIKNKIDELKAMRTSKQPLNYPSAGSAFKRPKDNFAGKLIMDAGLSGFSIGDAAVSKKHCGFFVNLGNATASDMKKLFDEVIRTVDEKFNVLLEPEVCFLGEF